MSGRLAIAKLSARCIVADSLQSASIVDRAIRALRDEFPDTARRAFAGWPDRPDESVWVVRRLDLAVMTAADVPTDMLAASVVMALGRALGESLSGEGDGANVIRFESRAAYLASFITDASTGDAWSRWYYAPLSGLRTLPTSCAIRTAIAQDPGIGGRALGRLGAASLARVASALTSQDEALIVDCLVDAALDGTADEELDFDAAWAECQRQHRHIQAPPPLLVGFVQGSWARNGHGFVRAMRQVRSWLQLVHSLGTRQRHHLLELLDAGAEEVPLGALGSAMPVPGKVLREMLVRATALERAESENSTSSNTTTQFGGALLLMRDVQELPWEELTRSWPQPQWSDSAFRTLQWLTLATCAGRERSSAALHDEALRHLFGIPATEPLSNIARWLRELGWHRCALAAHALLAEPETALTTRRGGVGALGLDRRDGIAPEWSRAFARAARRTLYGFARRLPGFAQTSPKYLWENFLAGDASLEYEDERVVVRYGRPPLHLMLTLTGMTRGLTTGRDARGRPIIVFARE